jgi:phosphomannomutase
MIFLFDVDGTLTPSRGRIDAEFEKWFIKFCKNNRVCLVTGSDYAKTEEQLGKDVLDCIDYSFNCSGNAIYCDHECVYESEWKCPDDLWLFLENELYRTHYDKKYGKHFEQRIGMLNFSIVGRNAVGTERTDYFEWDKISNERAILARKINERWANVQAAVGGETGIDIFERGCDKSQVLNYLKSGELMFFGDRIDPDGNDYSLAKAIVDNKRGQCYNVRDWNHTWELLKQCQNESASPANGSTFHLK